MRSSRTWSTIAIFLLLLAGCSNMPSVPPVARAELAPNGKLRVALIMSNQVLVSKDLRTGEIRGVTVELGNALAQRLGVPFEAGLSATLLFRGLALWLPLCLGLILTRRTMRK